MIAVRRPVVLWLWFFNFSTRNIGLMPNTRHHKAISADTKRSAARPRRPLVLAVAPPDRPGSAAAVSGNPLALSQTDCGWIQFEPNLLKPLH